MPKTLIVNMISVRSIMYGTFTFWQIRCCPTLMSLLLINTFENTPVGCNICHANTETWPRFDIHINTLMNEVNRNPNISPTSDRCRGIFHVRNNHCSTNICFFYNNVASFASTHSKTLQSDVIGRRQHGIRDHSSISTLMTKLLRKQWILTISPLVSDCTIGYNLSVSYNTRLKCRQTMPSHSIHVHAKFHSKTLIVNMISLSASIMYGTITFWQIRCCPTLMSLLLHQHIRKHASRM